MKKEAKTYFDLQHTERMNTQKKGIQNARTEARNKKKQVTSTTMILRQG